VIDNVTVVGRGRVGSAIAARLGERGVELREDGADVVLLCVPDRAIADAAPAIQPGPWVAHVSGGTHLSALDPHVRRFGLHPLQTFSRARGPEQLDGAFAAVSAETPEALATGFELAETLGLRAFELDDSRRALYHAGAVVASNYLVTLERAAAELVSAAGAPPEALVPLMTRTIENGFELTGPIERGDWETVEAHLEVLGERPELRALYETLAEATRELAAR
jgi:predicted short-subunit dehydrogenase-like oxidoreductase (DUF2520 family)